MRSLRMPVWLEKMMRGPYLFSWSAPDGGFVWKDKVPGVPPTFAPGPFLVPRYPLETLLESTEFLASVDLLKDLPQNKYLTAGIDTLRKPDVGLLERHQERVYAPLVKPNLHRTFARTPVTEEGILEFADEYGPLGVIQDSLLPVLRFGLSPFSYRAEPLYIWQREIVQMQLLAKMWDAANANKQDALLKYVYWDEVNQTVEVRWEMVVGGRTYKDSRLVASSSPLASNAMNDRLNEWEFGDTIAPARCYVRTSINQRLRGQFSAGLYEVLPDEVVIRPNNLLAALHLNFLLEVSGHHSSAIRCGNPSCSEYFIPEHGRQRYCCKSCRKNAYYHRHK